jgi:predicted kinase
MVEEYMIRSLLVRGQHVIVDNANHAVWIRAIYLQLAQEYDAQVIAVVFPRPEEKEWRRRCKETKFPWEIVEQLRSESECLTDYERRVMGMWSPEVQL